MIKLIGVWKDSPMSLQDIKIQSSYESGSDPYRLVNDFYIPALQESQEYYRISGFFNSNALIIAAKGIEALIQNGGSMKLLISPELSKGDIEIIKKHGIEAFDGFRSFDPGPMPDDHLKALAWMLDSGRLEIKIVVPSAHKNALFHEKIGFFFDTDHNILSFSGSINETASGWMKNVEEFKVFRSWDKIQNEEYLQKDLTRFIAYWNNLRKDTAIVYDIPMAVKKDILKIKPDDIWELGLMNRYRGRKQIEKSKHDKSDEEQIALFPHQKAAVQWWIKENYNSMFIMATGTGKTRSAIGCVLEKLKDKERLLIIVSTPQTLLSEQWKKEFEDLHVPILRMLIVDGNNGSKKRAQMETLLMDINRGLRKNGVVFTTHNSAARPTFTDIIKRAKQNCKILFICDEAHAAGSTQFRKGLLQEYDYRIALSATPKRMFDDEGTENLLRYFGNHPFQFTISEAMSTINPMTGYPFLNPYNYHPVFVYLTDEESTNYKKYTKSIRIEKNKKESDKARLESLYKARARVIKNAEVKPNVLKELVEWLKPRAMTNTIIFVSDKHIDTVMVNLKRQGARPGKITEDVSARSKKGMASDRTLEIKAFNAHERGCLVGINCLNEGIDIKNACTAIIMSSSTNAREYIQRIGRVIRYAPGKPVSEIYDFIVCLPGEIIPFSEIKRASVIAENASNETQVCEIFAEKGVDLYGDK